MKVCSRCKKEKEIIDFHNDKKTKDGLNYYCKECAIKMRNDYVKKNSNVIIEKSKNYYYINKERINNRKKEMIKNSEGYKKRLLKKQLEEQKIIEEKNRFKQSILLFINQNKIKNEIVNSDIGNFILYNLLIEYKPYNNIGLNSVKLKYNWFYVNNYLHYYNKIFELTKFLNVKKNVKIGERIYCILYGITELKKCIHCDHYVKYKQFTLGYEIHCGDKKCYIPLKGIIKDSNGLTANDRSQIALSEYLLKIDENGISNCVKRVAKIKKTKENKIINGLDSFEIGFKNGAGKNSSLKYYNTELYYQGTYEKYFLDMMSSLDLINDVKRGDRIKYINSAGVECVYRSDFKFRDIIFEIKSDYTYGTSKYIKNEHFKKNLDEKRINNNIKYKYTLLQGKRIFLLFNKKYWIELNIDMFNDININLYQLQLNSLKILDFNKL